MIIADVDSKPSSIDQTGGKMLWVQTLIRSLQSSCSSREAQETAFMTTVEPTSIVRARLLDTRVSDHWKLSPAFSA